MVVIWLVDFMKNVILLILFTALNSFAAGLTNKVTLAWDPSPDASVVGYRVYYGINSRGYTNSVTVNNTTNAVVTNLVSGITYYFGATAFDGSGLESDFSNEAMYTVPVVVVITTNGIVPPVFRGIQSLTTP